MVCSVINLYFILGTTTRVLFGLYIYQIGPLSESDMVRTTLISVLKTLLLNLSFLKTWDLFLLSWGKGGGAQTEKIQDVRTQQRTVGRWLWILEDNGEKMKKKT